jgi:hypothetical protein
MGQASAHSSLRNTAEHCPGAIKIFTEIRSVISLHIETISGFHLTKIIASVIAFDFVIHHENNR